MQLEVRVLLLQEEGKWVAQCLEYDVAAQADTLTGVQQAFVKSLASQVCVNLHHGKEPMEDVPAAPAYYLEQFKQAMQVKEPMLPKLPFLPNFDVRATAMAIAS